MPDHTKSDGSLLSPDSASGVPATAGALLKAARQAAGVHLAVLSVNLKVPVRQLEALEADQYAANESPVFVRALTSSVCRQLRVDPAPILALLPLSANYLEPTGFVRQAYVAPASLGRVRRSSGALPAQAKWAAIAMLVLIAALIWVPNPSQWAGLDALRLAIGGAESSSVSAPATVTETIVPGTAVSESPPQAVVQGEPALVPVGVPGIPGMSATPPATPLTAPSLAAATEPAKAATLPAAAPQAELVFSARNTSWVEVRDSQNQVLWNGVLNASDTKRLDAVASVFVVIGRADAVQVSFKGQPVDLQPHTKVNTARFEVKP
jgi:cytoskeleton protein RodZ